MVPRSHHFPGCGGRGSADSYILGSFSGFLAVSKTLFGPWPKPDEQGCSDSLPQQPAM
ncbi:hypothetical protein CRENBAI_013414, partial [Crenichthys baileyi]